MKAGIIGYGTMGRIRAKALRDEGRAEVTRVYDINPLPKEERSLAAASEAEIIEDPEIDLLFICSPNYRTVPLVKAGLRAGKHVFSEKPPAFRAKEMEEAISIEKSSGGKKLMYGFNHRHHESIKRAKEAINSGEYGRILWMRGRYGKNVDETFFAQWRADIKKAGGGVFLDQGIHMLDLFLHFAGDFHEVKSFVSNLFWKRDIEDNVFALFRNTESGVVASLHSTMTQWRHLFSLEVFLENGHIVLNGLKTTSGAYGDEELALAKRPSDSPDAAHASEEKHRYTVDTSWASEVTHFLDSVESDTPVATGNSADALKLMRLVDAVYEADEAYQRNI